MRVAIVRIISLGLLGILALVVGWSCQPGFNFQGKWQGNRNLKAPEGVSATVSYTIGKVDLTIDGGSFELFEGGMPKSGTVRYEPGKAFLKVDTVFERPIESLGKTAVDRNLEIELLPKDAQTISFRDSGGFDTSPILLKRQPKP